MPNVHTIVPSEYSSCPFGTLPFGQPMNWDSKGEKLGRSPNDKYSSNIVEIESLKHDLEDAIGYGFRLGNKYKELRDTHIKLKNDLDLL
jgi:hypothetical protein